jgi:hypothetical protein
MAYKILKNQTGFMHFLSLHTDINRPLNMTKAHHQELARQVNGAAMKVHEHFGPAFSESVESVYQKQNATAQNQFCVTNKCMCLQNMMAAISEPDCASISVENRPALELKTVKFILPIR